MARARRQLSTGAPATSLLNSLALQSRSLMQQVLDSPELDRVNQIGDNDDDRADPKQNPTDSVNQ